MVEVATMIDTIGASAVNVPLNAAFVGMYVSGTGDVPWAPTDQVRFPVSRRVLIYQGSGSYPGVAGYHMIDIESGAVTVPVAASEVEKRVQNGFEWTICYGTDATLASLQTETSTFDDDIAVGHVYCFLADWDLNETEAEAKLGTIIHGMPCIGVQWASPSSNPLTICPGTTGDLDRLNLDLSVVDASKLPLPAAIVAPQPPAQPPITGMAVYELPNGSYTATDVTSTDGGKTWA
jgi:hypothetical protein